MAALSLLYSSVRLYAQQCPDATIDKYLNESIRQFCRESWYYQQGMIINQTSGIGTYSIVPSTNDEVLNIEAVEQSGTILFPLTQEQASNPAYTYTGYQFEPPSYLVINPTPTTTVASGLELRLILQPPEGSTTIPDSVYRNYKETIVAGALSNILNLQNEAWSNPALSNQMLQVYYNGIFKAKGERMRGFRAGPIIVTPRPFLV